MTNTEFYNLFEKIHLEEKEIMKSKGVEYTVGSDDKLANFKETGKDIGIEPIKVLMIFLNKHLASIRNYVKDGVEASTEPIEGRITDARNYLALLRAIIEEKKNE